MTMSNEEIADKLDQAHKSLLLMAETLAPKPTDREAKPQANFFMEETGEKFTLKELADAIRAKA